MVSQIFMFLHALLISAVGCFAYDYLQGTPQRKFNKFAFAVIVIASFLFIFGIV
jgi:hypothetical protein